MIQRAARATSEARLAHARAHDGVVLLRFAPACAEVRALHVVREVTLTPAVAPQPHEPLWLIAARREIGIRETPGSRATPRIVEYHKSTRLNASSDETPWCASFVGWALAQAGQKGTGSARALSYASWGVWLDAPVLGCVAVLEYTGGRGHTGFVVGVDAGHVWLLGGNQGDSVSIKKISLAAIAGYRWPRGVPLPPKDERTLGPIAEGGALGGVAETR